MADAVANKDGIFVEEAVHHLYKQLTDGTDPVSVPFRTMKDVFMWSVCVGFRQGAKRPLSGKRVLVFRWAQFTPQTDVPLLKAVALADKEDIAILLDQSEVLATVQEYANAGIHELRASLLDEYSQPLWNLIEEVKRKNQEGESTRA